MEARKRSHDHVADRRVEIFLSPLAILEFRRQHVGERAAGDLAVAALARLEPFGDGETEFDQTAVEHRAGDLEPVRRRFVDAVLAGAGLEQAQRPEPPRQIAAAGAARRMTGLAQLPGTPELVARAGGDIAIGPEVV